MSEVLVICPNHGIVRRVEMACMWLGRPPMPEIDYAFCPKCGAKTIIEYPERSSSSVTYNWTQEDEDASKKKEINYYKEKYKDRFKKLLEG